jgi:Zn-dependent alcohol dehydrogenase
MTGFGAVFNRAQVRPLTSVVVVGAGGVGLNAIQAATLAGARPIIAVDILDTKLELARAFGATHLVNSARDLDPIKAVQEMTSGRGSDYVFVTVGSASAVRQGFFMSAPRAMTVIIGLVPTKDNISFSTFDFIGGERVLTGSGGGSTRLSLDIPRLVELYRAGLLKLDELITGHYSLSEVNVAIESTERGEALRNVIMFD